MAATLSRTRGLEGRGTTLTDERFVRFNVDTGEIVAIEMPDPAAVTVVAALVSALPTPHVQSDTSACSGCGEAIWLARADVAMKALIDAGARVLCVRCSIAGGLTPRALVTTQGALERVRLVTLPDRERPDA
jgi:hypothetical protein